MNDVVAIASGEKRGRLDSIQVMRAVAALLVLATHAAKEFLTKWGVQGDIWSAANTLGQSGVDIFFVISGIIMVYVTNDWPVSFSSAILFMKKRVLRIVPLYWLFTVTTIAISLQAASLKNHNDLDIGYIVSSFLFIPTLRPDGHITPALGLGWTLNYEMFFYVIFSLSFLVGKKFGIFAAFSVFAFAVLLGVNYDTSNIIAYYWTRPIIMEFAFGMLIAKLYLRGFRLHNSVAYAAGIGAVVYLAAAYAAGYRDMSDEKIRFWLFGVAAIAIVGGTTLARTPVTDLMGETLRRWGVRLGDASYSLYLTHMFFIRACTVAFAFIGSSAATVPLMIAVCIAVTVLGSIVVYDWIEMPTNRWLQANLGSKRRGAVG